MALFCEVMLLLHNWAEWAFWTETESGHCRSIARELGYWEVLLRPVMWIVCLIRMHGRSKSGGDDRWI